MNEVYVIRTEKGSKYKLQFTSERSGIIAPELLDYINAQGIEVVEISELFSRMIEHYVSRHRLEGISNKVVVDEGVAEPYYFHIISRSEHQQFADMIAEGHHKDFD